MHPPVLAVDIPASVYRAEGRGEMALVVLVSETGYVTFDNMFTA